MEARPRSWLQKSRQHRVAIGVIAVILVAIVALIIVGYQFNWTGFGGYHKVTTTTEITSPSPKVTRTEEYQPGKSFWDWLQLLGVLAIPVVVGFGVAWFTTQQGKVSDRENKDNQREAALQAYIDKMSELLLGKHLRGSQQGYEEVRNIGRIRTLTVLRRLDADRKGSVLQFLQEADLIKKNKSIIDLSDADLSYANLFGANLSGANLSGAYLRGAYLHQAKLSDAYLRDADLRGAYLSRADLRGAYLFQAKLNMASLNDADLRDADLSYADLSYASLIGADLSGADLRQADLTRAKVTIEQLDQAKSLEGANMPGGSRHP